MQKQGEAVFNFFLKLRIIPADKCFAELFLKFRTVKMNSCRKFFLSIFIILSAMETFCQGTSYIIGKADSAVYTVSWSPEGSIFATSGNNFVLLWYADTNTTKSFLVEHGVPVVSSRFSRDGKWFLSVGSDSSVIVRNLENSSKPAKITESSGYAVTDGDFLSENGFSVAFATKGRTLTGFFRLMETQDFIQKKIYDAPSPIYSVDVNSDGTKILIGTVDGRGIIVDSASGEVLQEVPRYVKSNIKMRFSPDGKEFAAASDESNIIISYTDKIGSRVIRDGTMFANAVVFSPDGLKLAAAAKNGSVKIFDSKNGKLIQSFFLVDGQDSVLSLDFSPDGEFLLGGTKNGYIYRWSLTGKVWDEKGKKYVNKEDSKNIPDSGKSEIKDLTEALKQALKEREKESGSGKSDKNGADSKDSDQASSKTASSTQPPLVKKENDFDVIYKKGHCLITDIGISLPPSHYNLELSVGFGYLNYNLIQPFYFGGVAKPFMAFVLGDFPYTYTLNGSPMASPKLTGLKIYAPLGFVFYPFFDHVEVFAELEAGLSLNWLWNARLGMEALWSDPFCSFYGAVRVGAGWRFIRFSVAGEYDQVLGLSFSGEVGFNITLGGGKKKKSED